jgi:hypothetical protein
MASKAEHGHVSRCDTTETILEFITAKDDKESSLTMKLRYNVHLYKIVHTTGVDCDTETKNIDQRRDIQTADTQCDRADHCCQQTGGGSQFRHQSLRTTKRSHPARAEKTHPLQKRLYVARAEALQMDAERRVRHSRTLDRNIRKANPGTSRASTMDAHHIVAQQDMRADDARKLLFNWGIGINDADNGVYMPRYSTSVAPSLPNCPDHQSIHTFKYFLTVTNALLDVSEEPTQAGREMLRSIKASLIAGTFPF